MRKTQIAAITIFTLCMIGAFGLFTRTQNPTPLPPPSTTPSAKRATRPTPTPSTSQSVSETTSHSAKRPSTDHIYTVAPKQLEIQKTIEHEYTYRVHALPNDPNATNNWVFESTRTPAAWSQRTGRPITIAVIDTGFALAHEDLADQWYINAGEQGQTTSADRCWTGIALDRQTNACDDDANGYVDDWRGWDFWQVDNSPQAGSEMPAGLAVSHGSSTAGLVGAASNNARGSASFNWSTRVMPLQAMSDDGEGYTSDVVAAVYYAVSNGASIINMSLGSSERDPALTQAVDYATAHDVLIVASAGNCGSGNEYSCDKAKPGAMGWPALEPSVMSVGAIGTNNVRASFSSYGPMLDIVAPGSGPIIAPVWRPTNQTTAYSSTLNGTSFSAPIVASFAGLIRSERPASSIADITALINGTAQKITPMNNKMYTSEYGHGLIDTARAMSVGLALGSSTAPSTLAQTGSHISEHTFLNSTTLSSGCSTVAASYCTIRAHNNTTGTNRYLPYSLTNSSGQVGWSWSGETLGSGEWIVTAQHANQISSEAYLLFQK